MKDSRARALRWMVGILSIAVLAGLLAWVFRPFSPLPASVADTVEWSPLAALPARPLSREDLLRQAERNPRDGRAWALLAYAEFDVEQYANAAVAFEKAVAVSPKVAADPGVLCDWADALGMAQGGSLRGRPSELVARALELRSTYPKALEMAGSAAYERRDFTASAEYWSRLLPQLDVNSATHRALKVAIARAVKLAATNPPPSH